MSDPHANRAFPHPSDAADRVVVAAIACIERDGIDGLTVRSIAREAGVNIAAVNYYFGSKDRLVAVVLERTLDRGVQDPLVDFDRLRGEGRDVRSALLVVLDGAVATAVRQPRTAFAHFYGPIVEQDYGRDVVVRTNAFLERLFQRLRKDLGGRGDTERRSTLAHLWSSVLMASLSPRLLHAFTGVDLADARQRRVWLNALVEGALRSRSGAPTRARAPARAPAPARGRPRARTAAQPAARASAPARPASPASGARRRRKPRS